VIPGDSQHVVYRGVDGHLHMLWYSDGDMTWRPADLNEDAHATEATMLPVGDPTGFVYEVPEDGGFWDSLWGGVKDVADTVRRVFSAVWDAVVWLLTPIAIVVRLLEAIPVVGSLFRLALNAVTGIVLGLVGFVFEGILCGLFGVCLPKHVRLCVVMFTVDGVPLATEQEFAKLLARTKQIFKEQANIEIDASFTICSSILAVDVEHTRAMDPPCGFQGFTEDAGGALGMQYQIAASFACKRWAAASIAGLGSPIYAFGVRDVGNDKIGCSLGPLSNYLVFEAKSECMTNLAHEMGHTLGLWVPPWTGGHLDDPDNLMYPDCVTPRRDQLRGWQKAIVRGSKYATYW
jgi:hypothetical protein